MPFQVKIPADETFEGHFSGIGNDGDDRDDSGSDLFGVEGRGYNDIDRETDDEPDDEPEEYNPLTEAEKTANALIADAKEQCADLKKEAEEQAITIIEEAQKQAESILDTAKKEGIDFGARTREESKKKGYQEGRAEGKAQYDALTQEAQQIKEQAAAEYQELMSGAEADAVDLVMDIARKVIGKEVEINRQNVLIMVKDAFDHCSNKDQAILKVSPDDYDYIKANKDVLLSLIDGVGTLEIKKDMSLQIGSCLVETPLGHIDAGITTKLNKIEAAFHKLVTTVANRQSQMVDRPEV